MATNKRCSEILRGGWSADVSSCTKQAKVERDGFPYCKIHDPEYVLARRQAQSTRWTEQYEQKQSEANRQALEKSACIGVPTEMLRNGLLKEVMEELGAVFLESRDSVIGGQA